MRTVLGRLAIVVAALIGIVMIAVAGIWVWLQFDTPTPVQQLLTDDATIDLATYDGSDPPTAGEPAVLILGVPHLTQDDYGFAATEFDAVTDALSRYEPALVVVEHLPPDWPAGQGRDYRPGFDLDTYAQLWELTRADAEALTGLVEPDASDIDQPCQLGRAYFLQRDLATAHHLWSVHDCADVHGDDDIEAWWEEWSDHELGRIAQPVARANGVWELVSFDHRGRDTRWLLGEEVLSWQALRAPGDLWQMLPTVNPRTREFNAHTEAHDASPASLLHHLNGPAWAALQYWSYEQQLPGIEVNDVGQRQLDNYWGRNQHLFERLDTAVRERKPERVLVVVGAGHRYFLDELAREAGYRWIDPRDWLPTPRPERVTTVPMSPAGQACRNTVLGRRTAVKVRPSGCTHRSPRLGCRRDVAGGGHGIGRLVQVLRSEISSVG